jgi:hypothetical protein
MPPTKEKSAKVLQGGRDVHSVQNESVITQYFQTKLAVVEVRPGESQEDAWHRYLADNPDNAGAHVKIFHYPEPSPLKKNGDIRSEFPLAIRTEKLI